LKTTIYPKDILHVGCMPHTFIVVFKGSCTKSFLKICSDSGPDTTGPISRTREKNEYFIIIEKFEMHDMNILMVCTYCIG
jgi:hypothetical protein